MNSQTVYHNWAHQVPKRNGSLEARAGNCSYDGEYAYSYAAPIARRIPFGSSVVWLVTSRSYSVTTSKHTSYALRAIPFGALHTFTVPRLDVENMGAHVDNLRHFAGVVAESLDKARRARKYGPYHLEHANRIRSEWERYCQVFGIDFDSELPAELSPENVARVVASVEWGRLAGMGDRLGVTRESLGELDRSARDCVVMSARALAHAEKPESDSLRAWRAGSSHLPGSSEFDALRVDGDAVRTSRGVSVGAGEVAEKLPAVVRAVGSVPLGSELASGSVGPYAVRVGRGYVRVGCHVFTATELARLARELPSLVAC